MYFKKIPNILTFSRILVVPFLVALFYSNILYSKFLILFLFFISSITDYFDGYLARKYNLVTTIGKFIDPLADKLLILTTFFLIHSLYPEAIPLWMVFIIFVRDIFVTFLRLYCSTKKKIMKTSIFAKRKTLIQIVVIHFLLILHAFNLFFLYGDIAFFLMFICVFFTVVSGCHYFIINFILDE